MKRNLLIILITVAALVAISGCENDYPPAVWKENDPGSPTPVITAVTPPDTSFEGVGIIEITGQNFSSLPTENLVFFNDKRATVLEASATRLKVQAPVLISVASQNAIDSVKIKVAVQGAYLFGDYKKPDGSYRPYRLEKAAIEYGDFSVSRKPHAIDCDNNEVIYVASEANMAIWKIYLVGDTVKTEQWSGGTAVSIITGLKVGPQGKVFFVRNNRYIYTVASAGAGKTNFIQCGGNVYDIDFNVNGDVYGVGKDSVYCVNSTGTPKTHYTTKAYKGFTLTCVRVFNGYVYVSGTYTGTDASIAKEGIWRSQIVANDSLGWREEVLNWKTCAYATGALTSFTLDEDGNLYIGGKESYDATPNYTGGNALIKLNMPSKVPEVFYGSILFPPATHMTWGSGNFMYVVRLIDNETAGGAPKIRIIRVDMDKKGAPYYGRSL